MAGGYFSTEALVLREVKYKEADKILTLLTSTHGKMTVKAPGALRKNSKFAAPTQILTYSDITVLERNGMINITEASIKEQFKGLRLDFENYSLGCYIAEVLENFTGEDETDTDILRLGLNCLYALSNNICSPERIKAAFELRLMCLSGYKPDLSSCVVCGKTDPQSPTFGYETGHICCRTCRNAEVGVTDYLCEASLQAMRFICSCGMKKLLSFSIDEEAEKRMSIACEDFLVAVAGRGFSTLDYWKKIKI